MYTERGGGNCPLVDACLTFCYTGNEIKNYVTVQPCIFLSDCCGQEAPCVCPMEIQTENAYENRFSTLFPVRISARLDCCKIITWKGMKGV